MSQQVDPVKERTRKGLQALADEDFEKALCKFSNANLRLPQEADE